MLLSTSSFTSRGGVPPYLGVIESQSPLLCIVHIIEKIFIMVVRLYYNMKYCFCTPSFMNNVYQYNNALVRDQGQNGFLFRLHVLSLQHKMIIYLHRYVKEQTIEQEKIYNQVEQEMLFQQMVVSDIMKRRSSVLPSEDKKAWYGDQLREYGDQVVKVVLSLEEAGEEAATDAGFSPIFKRHLENIAKVIQEFQDKIVGENSLWGTSSLSDVIPMSFMPFVKDSCISSTFQQSFQFNKQKSLVSSFNELTKDISRATFHVNECKFSLRAGDGAELKLEENIHKLLHEVFTYTTPNEVQSKINVIIQQEKTGEGSVDTKKLKKVGGALEALNTCISNNIGQEQEVLVQNLASLCVANDMVSPYCIAISVVALIASQVSEDDLPAILEFTCQALFAPTAKVFAHNVGTTCFAHGGLKYINIVIAQNSININGEDHWKLGFPLTKKSPLTNSDSQQPHIIGKGKRAVSLHISIPENKSISSYQQITTSWDLNTESEF